MAPLLVSGYHGLGDTIYQRPALRALSKRYEVYFATSWPQMLWDMPAVKVCREDTRMRPQCRNAAGIDPNLWSVAPPRIPDFYLSYSHAELTSGASLRTIFCDQARKLPGVEPDDDFSLPLYPSWIEHARHVSREWPRPFAILRPPTVRTEWKNEARNPDPAALRSLVDCLQRRGVYVVSIADVEGMEEWFADEPPACDATFHRGEFPVTTILALMRLAHCTLGGVGFIAPAGLAIGANAFIVFGGCGAHNHPALLADDRMDLSRFGYVAPEPLCPCGHPPKDAHRCNKQIEPHRLLSTFERWIDRLPKRSMTP